MGGPIILSKPSLRMFKRINRYEARVIKATKGRVKLSPNLPMVVLTSKGARSGELRETPLAYFTDGDAVVLIASNYGGAKHPAWYHNLRAHPDCQLYIGPRGGSFVATESIGAERDRLYQLAVDRLNHVFALHDERSGPNRTIPVMRLTPAEHEAAGDGR